MIFIAGSFPQIAAARPPETCYGFYRKYPVFQATSSVMYRSVYSERNSMFRRSWGSISLRAFISSPVGGGVDSMFR